MGKDRSTPPRFSEAFLRLLIKEELLEEILGDLEEYYLELETLPKWKKKVFYWFHLFHFLRPFSIKKLEGNYQLNYYGMFKNYFKVGLRNILKYKLFSFINVFGLAVAMSVCMLIILMLADQKSYDQFHSDKSRVYRILGTPTTDSMVPYATTPQPLAQTLQEEFPILESSVMLRRGVGGDASFNQKTVEIKGYFSTSEFFEIFSFPLEKGDPNTALTEPNSIVISTEKAYQLFNTENPIGKQITFEDRGLHIMELESGSPAVSWGTFTVTGVIDIKTYKTHLKLDGLVSASTLTQLHEEKLLADLSQNWESYWSSYAYVKLKEGVSEDELHSALTTVAEDKYVNSEKHKDFVFAAQKLGNITPGEMINNEPTFRLPVIGYYILSLLALVIMVMACLNYTNLSVARSLSRMKEIGVRKVTGASRSSLIFQFLTESVITVLFALGAAIVMLYFTKEAFMNLWFNKYLNFELSSSLSVFVLFVVFALAIGILAGTYPALLLSKKRPVDALKPSSSPTKKWSLQKVLNVSQFVVSLVFIVTSMVIYDQFKHYTSFEYGFNSENIINIPLQSNDYQTVVNEFSSITGVKNISACDYIPATGITNVVDLSSIDTDEEPVTLIHFNVDEHFIDNLAIKLISGDNIGAINRSDKHIVINESAVTKLGYDSPEQAIGEIWKQGKKDATVQIVGVVENFRATLLVNGDEIRPLALRYNADDFQYLNVRISEGNPLRTIADLEQKWKALDPVHEFRYDFYENELANTNLAIFDIVAIVGYISFLAILISCLGLFGMATYTTERKTKEVGIRKVLGAAELTIVYILSKSFLKLLAIAIIIAAPLSYFINSLWLENLPNRVDFGFETVIIGVVITLGIGLITIGSQTFSAARRNPVESLKDE